MLKEILKIENVRELKRNELKFIFGGKGNCSIFCSSGATIENAPNSSQEVQDHACQNQGGATGFICAGEEIAWER
jgi:hypothetical protein